MSRCEPLNQKAIEKLEEQNWGGKWTDAELDQTGPPERGGQENKYWSRVKIPEVSTRLGRGEAQEKGLRSQNWDYRRQGEEIVKYPKKESNKKSAQKSSFQNLLNYHQPRIGCRVVQNKTFW